MRPNGDPRFIGVRAVGGKEYGAYLDAGYSEHHVMAGDHGTPFLFRKEVVCDKDILYTINAWAIDNSQNARASRLFDVVPQVKFGRSAKPGSEFCVTYADWNISPELVEAFFADVYKRMECEPYEKARR